MENLCYASEQTTLLQTKKKSVHFQLPVGNLPSSSSLEDIFHQLSLQHNIPCDSVSEVSIKTHSVDRERLDCEELSEQGAAVLQRQGLTEDKCEIYGHGNMNIHLEDTDSQLNVGGVGISVQTPVPLTKYSEKHPGTSTNKVPEGIQLEQSSVSSGSFSLQSSIPVWVSETFVI